MCICSFVTTYLQQINQNRYTEATFAFAVPDSRELMNFPRKAAPSINIILADRVKTTEAIKHYHEKWLDQVDVYGVQIL